MEETSWTAHHDTVLRIASIHIHEEREEVQLDVQKMFQVQVQSFGIWDRSRPDSVDGELLGEMLRDVQTAPVRVQGETRRSGRKLEKSSAVQLSVDGGSSRRTVNQTPTSAPPEGELPQPLQTFLAGKGVRDQEIERIQECDIGRIPEFLHVLDVEQEL